MSGSETDTSKAGSVIKRGSKIGDILSGPGKEKPSRVSPTVAALMSAVVPGLGQIFARRGQRGVLLFVGAFSVVGMFIWRIGILGQRAQTAGWGVFAHAFQRRPEFVTFIIAVTILFWVLNAIDASRIARRIKKGQSGAFLALIAALFVLGWQVSEINLGTAIRRFPNAIPPLASVVWPWEAAVESQDEVLSASAQILVSPEGELPPVPADPPPGEPYVEIEPRQGQLSVQTLSGERADIGNSAGSQVTVRGYSFEPDQQVEIFWRDNAGNEFPIRRSGRDLVVEPKEDGSFSVQFTLPFAVIGTQPSDSGTLHEVIARQYFLGDLVASQALVIVTSLMVETIVMGMMATLFGIMLAIPVSFLAARNIMAGSPLTMGIYYFVRFIMNVVRSVEPLIWALIATIWVGLGPFAGIIALTMHSIAALSKLYSEAIEGIDPGPIEAIQATGASRLQTIAYAIIPQMISPFVSFSIYRWDINVRMSTIIGTVGGGGVGFILVQYIRLFRYREAGIAVWFIAVTVALLDYASAEIRNKLA